MFILVILSLFVLGDLLWTVYAVGRLRQPGVRGTPASWFGLSVVAGFMLFTVACLAVVILGRAAGSTHVLPKPVLMTVFLWHLLVLPATLVLGTGVALTSALARLASFLTRPAQVRSTVSGVGNNPPPNTPLPHLPPASPQTAQDQSRTSDTFSPHTSDPNASAHVLAIAPPAAGTGGRGVSRRKFLALTASVAPPAAVALTTAVALPRLDDLRIRQLEVPVGGLPLELDGLTIAHLSDTHLGDFTPGSIYRKLIDATNALRCDLIVHTGDIINVDSDDIPEAVEGLKRLDARHGVFVCEGNHDLIQSPGRFWKAMRDVNAAGGSFRFLRNEAETITVRGRQLQLLGLRWGTRDSGRARSRSRDAADAMVEAACDDLEPAALVRPDATRILLAHHPHAFDFAPWAHLTLAGHTHGGQLNITKHLSPGYLMYRYWSGLYRADTRSLVVSNGAGNWFPLRINAPAEILKLTLRAG